MAKHPAHHWLPRLARAGLAEEDVGEDVGGADGGGGASEDDAAFIEDVSAVDDVEYTFDVVLNDHDGRLELLAAHGDFLKDLFGYVTSTLSRTPHASVRGSGLLDET